MTTKLEIIGPYTPDHDGPYAIDSEIHSECMFARVNIHCVVDGIAFITSDDLSVPWCTRVVDLMNAREARVPREVWLPQFENGDLLGVPMNTKEKAEVIREANGCVRLIHFREVVEGE